MVDIVGGSCICHTLQISRIASFYTCKQLGGYASLLHAQMFYFNFILNYINVFIIILIDNIHVV